MKYKKYIINIYKKVLTCVHDTHKNKKKNDKRVLGIAQLCLSAEQNILAIVYKEKENTVNLFIHGHHISA